MERHVQRDAGLSHTGAGRDQNQFGLVQAQDHPVQVGQAGGDARELVPGIGRFGHLVEHVLHDGRHRHQSADVPSLPKCIDFPLRGFQRGLRFPAAFIDDVIDLVCRFTETAQQCTVPYNGGILQDIGCRGRHAHHFGHILLAVILIDAAYPHLPQHGNRIHRHAVSKHAVDRVVDISVQFPVKLIRPQAFHHRRDTVRVDQNRTDDRLLRLR